MAITVTPPADFTQLERTDILVLTNLIVALATVLDTEAKIATVDRLMTTDAITSINKTITDASDRIDVIINPAAPLA